MVLWSLLVCFIITGMSAGCFTSAGAVTVGDGTLNLSASALSTKPLLLEVSSAGEQARPPDEGRGRGLILTLPLFELLKLPLLDCFKGGGNSNAASGWTVCGDGAGGRIGRAGGSFETVARYPLSAGADAESEGELPRTESTSFPPSLLNGTMPSLEIENTATGNAFSLV